MLSQKSSPVSSEICKWSKLPIEILRLKNAFNFIFAYRNFGSISPINLTSPRLSSAQNTSITTAHTSSTIQIIIQSLQLQSSTYYTSWQLFIQTSKTPNLYPHHYIDLLIQDYSITSQIYSKPYTKVPEIHYFPYFIQNIKSHDEHSNLCRFIPNSLASTICHI